MKKLRVGVLMGGRSIEHEVSFNSGRTVCDHLDTERYDILPVYQQMNGQLWLLPWHFLHRGKTTDFTKRLVQEAKSIAWDDLKDLIDFMYLALHGRYAEDGTVQGMLEVLSIPYLGSDVFSSSLCMDKVIQKNFLAAAGISVPHGIVVSAAEISAYKKSAIALHKRLEKNKLSVPLIVKPRGEGSSLGVSVVDNLDQLANALHNASSIHQSKPQDVLIEERLRGMEFSCIIIEDFKTGTLIPLPPTEIAQDDPDKFFDYEQKYMPGRAHEHTPCRCDKKTIKKIQDVCVAVTKLLNVSTVSRTDGYVTTDGDVVIFECNTISGMSPTSLLFREAAEVGMSHTATINHLIETDIHSYGLAELMMKENKKSKAPQAPKMRIAVLLGGASNEREISLESGRNVIYKLSPELYQPIPVFVNSSNELFKINQSLLVRNSTKEIESLLEPSMKFKWADLTTITDFVFIALHGGIGENGAVQGALEMMDMPYNGSSVLASALCMDKYRSCQYLKQQGIAVPESILVEKSEWIENKNAVLVAIAKQISLPRIVKPHDDGCSVMVQKIKREEDMAAAIDLVFAGGKSHVLVEEFLVGMELTVGVLGNDEPKALPPSQVVLSSEILSIEEKFLPGAGENQTPAHLPAEAIVYVQHVIETAYKLVGCKGYARVDCFYQNAKQSPTGKERLVIIEFNTLPGLTPATCFFHQTSEIGLKPMEVIDKIIQLGLQEHAHAAQQPKAKGTLKDQTILV